MWRRITKYLREFLGFGSAAEGRKEPESVLQSRKELFEKQLSHYNRSLAASANLCEVLRNQIKALESQEAAARAVLEAHIQAGASEAAAGELALRWQSAHDDLARLREQLERAQTTCNEITLARDVAIEEARKQFADLKGSLSQHQIDNVLAEVLQRHRPG